MKQALKQLESLGFEKIVVPAEESGCEFDFEYYTYDIGPIALISNSNDFWEEEGVIVELFNDECIKWKIPEDIDQVKSLINILESALNKNNGKGNM